MPEIIVEIVELENCRETLWYNPGTRIGVLHSLEHSMAVLTASKLAKSFGAEDIFMNVSVSIPHGARIALVGPNGGGKTTLVRILVGLEEADAGEVHRAGGQTIGYLPQKAEHAFVDEGRSVWDEMVAVFAELCAQELALRTMEAQMGAAGAPADLMACYGAAVERFEREGGYTYEARIRRVLSGLRISDPHWQMPLAHLSGGQKTRALLAKLLLQSPSLLVLDEPTNHLDIQAIEWLETQLVNWPGALLIVCHDRFFLDRVVNRVFELDFGELETFRGSYSAYVEQRAERMERRLAEFRAQQSFVAKEEEFIRRHLAGQRTKEAQGRRKRLNRLKRDALVVRPRQNRQLQVRFRAARRSGDIVLQTKGVVIGYSPDAPLFAADDIDFRRTECSALIGPNGTGKTTFLKTILGQVPPLAGELRLGASLEIGHYSQAHDDLSVDADDMVLDKLLAHRPMLTSQARDYLARFMFTGDDVFKSVSALSGGERSRLALALLMTRDVNFLLLDEPTTHLDISSQEVLESVLSEFDGTILLVTHDRYLVSRLATQVWGLEGERLRVYDGGYDEYLVERERHELALRATRTGTRRMAGRHQGRRPAEGRLACRAQQVETLEQVIADLEARLLSLSLELEEASVSRQFDKLRQLGLEYGAVESDLERRMAEWTDVADG